MGHAACTEPQCLYKGALYLYLMVELYLYPPMGRAACTEPQCLYKGALYTKFRHPCDLMRGIYAPCCWVITVEALNTVMRT